MQAGTHARTQTGERERETKGNAKAVMAKEWEGELAERHREEKRGGKGELKGVFVPWPLDFLCEENTDFYKGYSGGKDWLPFHITT